MPRAEGKNYHLHNFFESLRILKEEKEKGKLIIISTHIKEDLDNLSDFIYYFDAGEVHTK